MSPPPEDVDREVEKILNQAMSYDEYQLLSGLAVLMVDANEYFNIHTNGEPELETFRSVYADTMTSSGFWVDWETRKQWELDMWEDVYDVTGLEPGELTKRAAQGNPDVTPLGDPNIEHEWFIEPGLEFLNRFGEKFRETICGPGGPYEQFENGLVGQEQLPQAIVSTILTAQFSGGAVWIPMATYVGLLVTKAGLKTYCETPEQELQELV